MAQKIGFEKLYLKNRILRGYFISNPESNYFQTEKFGKILLFVQKNLTICKMKEIKGKLTITFNKISSIEEAFETLKKLNDTVS